MASFRGSKPPRAIYMGRCATGQSIVCRPNSRIRLGDSLLKEALALFEIPEGEDRVDSQINMGRVVGVSHCVTVGPEDKPFWARTKTNPRRYMRFVEGRQPDPCEFVSLRLDWSLKERAYLVIMAYVGELAPKFPYDPDPGPAAEAFWQEHALIPYGDDLILLETVRETVPYDYCLAS